MFCDLVGSTALSRRLDPEDLREVIRQYQDAVSGVVVRHGGYVANFLGDGIIAYFGWPRADEDEAAQAVRAGLEAVEMVRRLPRGSAEQLSSRVGIASGTVVVGDIEAAGRRQTGAIAGDTPNLAARLQALADADQVVIDSLTRQLVGAIFVFQDLGPQALKGLAEPVQASRVLAERATESRFEAREGRLTPFIGRAQEMALLVERFERAVAGEGQAVLLSGEAGMGKSRIVQTLCERLSSAPHTRMRMQCSPFHTTSTLYPVTRHLEYAAGFLPDDGPDARVDKLDALLRQAGSDTDDSLAALGPLLSLPVDDRYVSVGLTAEQRQVRVLNALVDQFLGLADRNPVLFILEDAHWIDPATRELITQTLVRVAEARVLMVITHRPDWQTDWVRHPQVTALTLNRLSREQGAEIVRATAATALPEEIVARILRRADGVPLFIEELTRSVVETGGTSDASGVPETLQASLLARLDRLGPEIKEIAQIAAVIGREFGSELLGAVAEKSRDALAPALDGLVASHIVLPTGAAQGGYLFRHALIQDAAYQSLLLSRRREYHSRIARVLESQFAEIAEPELIAHHFTAAAEPEQAIPYWVKAGERALARFTYLEPLAHFEQALQLARDLPEGPGRSRHMLNLLLLVGEAHLRLFRQEALQAFAEATELAREVGTPADLARAALGAEETDFFMHDPVNSSAALLEAALAALGQGDNALRCRVLSHLGRALFKLGEFDRGPALMREATDAARRLGDRRALCEALGCEYITTAGQPWAARQFPTRLGTLDEMTAIAEELGDRPELILRALTYAIAACLEMNDLAAFEARLARYDAVAQKGQVAGAVTSYHIASIGALRAILHGDFAAAETLAEQALEASRGIHNDVGSGVYGMQMFTIRREQGRLAEVAPLMRRFLANSRDAAWRPGLALIAADLGFKEAAQKSFAEMATANFAFPIDGKRNITLCYLAEVCARVSDVERANQLYELLAPYRDLAVVVPTATICCGSNARYLGMLATVIGDWAAAEAHFEAALEMDERLQAWPWLAHTKHEFAQMLRLRGRPGDVDRADDLLAAAAASAERFGMASLQASIRSLGTELVRPG
jgi:class 3 adenylate cyclase/tetratricopeptide (TPR) repeat protein